jgi:hypothetical protein
LPGDPWSLLSADIGGPNVGGTGSDSALEGGPVIPAIADATVITWGLGKKIGDVLTLVSEDGTTARVRLVAALSTSIFQGSLLVSESALARHFPSATGHLLYLADAPAGSLPAARRAMEESLAPLGLSLESGAARLARFDAVEIAYLEIFALLGWLGMMLGTLGLGIVVLRNIDETRGDLALLRAVGLQRTAISRMVFVENALPVVIGLAAGVLASALVVIPRWSLARHEVDAVPVLGQVTGILAASLAFILLCTLGVLRANLTDSLRGD